MIGNLFALLCSVILSPAASFLIIILIARFMGKEFLGHYTTMLAWMRLFQAISPFGIGEVLSRESGRSPKMVGKHFSHSLAFGLGSCLVCAGLMAGGLSFIQYPNPVRQAILLSALTLFPAIVTLLCQSVIIAFQRIQYILYAGLVENILLVLICSAAIFYGGGLISLVLAMLLARGVGAAVSLSFARQFIFPCSFRIDLQFFRALLSMVLVFGLTGIFSGIFLRVDTIILSMLKDAETVGLYSAVAKLMEFCLLLPLSFYAINLPVTARQWVTSGASLGPSIEQRAQKLFLLICLLVGASLLFAHPIVVLIYGHPFLEAVPTFQVMMIAVFVCSGEVILSMVCQATGHQKAAMVVALIRMVTSLLFDLILIPPLGHLGAGLATLLSLMLTFACFQGFVSRKVMVLRWRAVAAKPVMAMVGAMGLLYPFAGQLPSIALGILYLLGYGLLLLLMVISGPVSPLKVSKRSI